MMRTLIFMAVVLLLSGCSVVQDYEGPEYRVLKTADADSTIEIREYAPTIAAHVTVEAERRDAINTAFRILFDYIQGANTPQTSIAMTAPVTQQVTQSAANQPTEIPMTAPVTQQRLGSPTQVANYDQERWQVAFYVPTKFTPETVPQPTDSRVTVELLPPRTLAVIQFSGRATDGNLFRHEKKLRDYLATTDLTITSLPILAYYDSPWTLWFLRRNEILFEVTR